MPRLLVLGLIAVLAAGSAQAAPGFGAKLLRAGGETPTPRETEDSSFLSSVAQMFGIGQSSKSAVSTEEVAEETEGTVKEECDEKPGKSAASKDEQTKDGDEQTKDEQAKMAKQVGPEPIYLAF